MKLSFKINFEYKISWLMICLFALDTVIFAPLFWFLLTGGNEINGWAFPELVLLSLISLMANALIALVGFFNTLHKIKKELTIYLVKPLSPFLQLIGREIWYASLLEFFIYLVPFVFILNYYNIQAAIFLFIIFFLISFVFQAMLAILPVVVALFWYDAGQDVSSVIWNFFDLSRNPLDKIKTGNIFLSSILFPLMFIAVFPVKALTGDKILSFELISKIVLILLTIGFFEYFLWKRGIKQYESLGG